MKAVYWINIFIPIVPMHSLIYLLVTSIHTFNGSFVDPLKENA